MPYGYYELVRIIALLSFGYLAFKSFDTKEEASAFVYLALAVLFQPIFKISLGRDIWNILDVIVATGLIFSLRKRSVN
jgi:hypothetical protein